MSKYRIRIHTSRGYRGYFWDVEHLVEGGKTNPFWSRATKGGYAFTYWGAKLASKRAARKHFRFEPFERIEEL